MYAAVPRMRAFDRSVLDDVGGRSVVIPSSV
jgi:hypothetical protein